MMFHLAMLGIGLVALALCIAFVILIVKAILNLFKRK